MCGPDTANADRIRIAADRAGTVGSAGSASSLDLTH
jgi:hypothetical protein